MRAGCFRAACTGLWAQSRSRALAHALGRQRERRLHLGQPMAAHGPRCERNVARLQQGPRSVLWLYRSLIRLRKQEKALTAGSYVPLRSRNDVLMFKRSYGDTELLAALNFSHDPRKLPFDATAALLISTHLDYRRSSPVVPSRSRGRQRARCDPFAAQRGCGDPDLCREPFRPSAV